MLVVVVMLFYLKVNTLEISTRLGVLISDVGERNGWFSVFAQFPSKSAKKVQKKCKKNSKWVLTFGNTGVILIMVYIGLEKW